MNIRKFVFSTLAAVVLAAGAMLPFAAEASIVIAGTRVVYKATDSEVAVKLSNVGKTPALTQVWLDKGDPKADPSALDLPFVLTPPFARIDPDKAQTIRIAYTGEALPKDRETVLWFNVLEVPPKPSAEQATANYVQLAFRTRVKFFFRPAGLQGNADDAPAKLTWRLVNEGGKSALVVTNPTPYHVTIIEAHVGDGEHAPKFDAGGMVDPLGQLTLPLSGTPGNGGRISFTTLNDYGGAATRVAALQ